MTGISGLSGYFAMQAAGASGKDLEASLEAVRQNFERFLKERKLESVPLFSGLALVTPEGGCWWQYPGKEPPCRPRPRPQASLTAALMAGV